MQLSCSGTDFVPYIVDDDGLCMMVDMPGYVEDNQKALSERTPSLFVAIKRILKEVEKSNRYQLQNKVIFSVL